MRLMKRLPSFSTSFHAAKTGGSASTLQAAPACHAPHAQLVLAVLCRSAASSARPQQRIIVAGAIKREKPLRDVPPVERAVDSSHTEMQERPEMEKQRSKLAKLNTYHALVLDLSYKPIDIVNWQRAICLDMFEKVDVLEYYDIEVSSARDLFPLPAVVRVRMYLKRTGPAMRVHLSRRNILVRDKHTCQYCGKGGGRELSVDHVKPISKGGQWTWENLVTACKPCNQKKGDKTLSQMGWKPLQTPKEPTPADLGVVYATGIGEVKNPPKEWSFYMDPFFAKQVETPRLISPAEQK